MHIIIHACLWVLATSFTKELASTTEQRTVHITPNKAEFLQTMMSCHNDDYEVFL